MTKASNTRRTILENAFDLIYKKGYQTTSVDDIIATTKVTKGAFYYHFKTKDEMGVAIVKEIIKPTMQDYFILPLQDTLNPLEEIYRIAKSLLLENPVLTYKYGCPVGNLIQEMTPWNTKFTKELNTLILEWQNRLEAILKKSMNDSVVNEGINPNQVTHFVISSYWGIRNFSKITDSNACYHTYLKELKVYLNALK